MEQTRNDTETGLRINTGNEITRKGLRMSGFFFILFTLLPILTLIAYWPDRLPESNGTAIYRHELFNICLLDSDNKCETCLPAAISFTKEDSNRINGSLQSMLDSQPGNIARSYEQRVLDSVTLLDSLYGKETISSATEADCDDTIRLNTLLLILVATAGFLGTMIHIASSFTNYVGSEKFKKSWVLWYAVKPFTGAALAVIFYFIFRAGLLNFNDAGNINLYGIITLAALVGLFTDKATMKLEEIFEVIFKPKDNRPDKLNSDQVNVRITGIKPESLLSSTENELIISGEGLNKKKLIIKVDDDEIKNPVIKEDSISFSYKIPDLADKQEFLIRVFDEHGKEIYNTRLKRGEDLSTDASSDIPPGTTNTGSAAGSASESSEGTSNDEFGPPDATIENDNTVKE